jgi:type II secretory pathway pseudopilin PulG
MQQTHPIHRNDAATGAGLSRPKAREEFSAPRRRRDGGAMLLAVLFMMAMMVIVALAVAPSLIQQAKRDREEEMIHRGTEYARAIKKYYKKFGRYPANLEQLDNTNQMRFLRRQFKDPLTKDGKWKLLHAGDIAAITGIAMPGMPGVRGLQGQGSATGLPAGSPGTVLGGAAAQQGAQALQQQASTSVGDQSSDTQTSPLNTANTPAAGQAGAGQAAGQVGNTAGAQSQSGQTSGAPGQGGSSNSIFGNSGVGGQTFGGGAIVGVASLSKDPTIRIYNKKQKYEEWVFIYSPMMDRVNVLLRGPFNGQTITNPQVGTPAGQINQGNQGYGLQAPGVTGQPGGPTQQPNQQQLTPGGQFPPDQTQPQPQQ